MDLAGFLAALRADIRSKVPLIVWATVSLAVTVSGPFGSYASLSLAERAVFWPLLIALAVTVSCVIRAFVHGVLELCGSLFGALLTALMITVALTPILYLAVQMVFDPVFGGLLGFSEIIVLIGSISLGVCSLRVASGIEVAAAPEVSLSAPELPRLLRRLEAEMQGELWAITVRDHYVDVQTSKGKSSLLMRFSDAIDEAEPVPGAQVHRSHWVAWDGVGSVCREGGKVILHLKNGHQIPVSRNHRDKVDLIFPPMPAVKDVAA